MLLTGDVGEENGPAEIGGDDGGDGNSDNLLDIRRTGLMFASSEEAGPG